jgi:hypothetical protein
LDEQTASVSGVYRTRFDSSGRLVMGGQSERICAFNGGTGTDLQFVTERQLSQPYVPVSGSGFGCLLIRREALRAVPLSVTEAEPWYDPRFFRLLGEQDWRFKLASEVVCDHGEIP